MVAHEYEEPVALAQFRAEPRRADSHSRPPRQRLDHFNPDQARPFLQDRSCSIRPITTLAFGLESGIVHLNDCTVADEPHVPFGGVKNSGFGREGGRFSMEEMTEVKWITMQRGQRGFPM